jgi:hypothetical protein
MFELFAFGEATTFNLLRALVMARNDGHCASVPVGQQPFPLSTRILNYPFTSCQGIRNFKYSRGCCLLKAIGKGALSERA